VDFSVTELVDGAMFNSGQSCCAIDVSSQIFLYTGSHDISKRIYVHEALFDEFVAKFVKTVKVNAGAPLGQYSHVTTTPGIQARRPDAGRYQLGARRQCGQCGADKEASG